MIASRKGGGVSKFIQDDDEDIEECRRHIELIVEECNEIKKASTEETRYCFQRSVDYLDS